MENEILNEYTDRYADLQHVLVLQIIQHHGIISIGDLLGVLSVMQASITYNIELDSYNVLDTIGYLSTIHDIAIINGVVAYGKENIEKIVLKQEGMISKAKEKHLD